LGKWVGNKRGPGMPSFGRNKQSPCTKVRKHNRKRARTGKRKIKRKSSSSDKSSSSTQRRKGRENRMMPSEITTNAKLDPLHEKGGWE